MKHVNKGHEFDTKAQELLEKINNKEKFLYLFGAGEVGQLAYDHLKTFNCVAGYIDNFPKQKEFNNLPVLTLNEYLKDPKGIVLITVGNMLKDDIATQLEKHGLVLNKDFYHHFDFLRKTFPIIMCYKYNKAYVFDACSIVLTLRCTLKCKDCCMLCHEAKHKKLDLTFEEIKSTVDNFFAKFDYSENFELIGGEPLLHKDLTKIVTYIGENYRSKIGTFLITTNCTIIPSEDLLKQCKTFNTTFKITDYSSTIPEIKSKCEKMKSVLLSNKINFNYIMHDHPWIEMGYKNSPRLEDVSLTIKRFDDCDIENRKLYKNKFYRCLVSITASESLDFETDNSDYLDLDKIDKDDKISLIEYDLGYNEKGYLSMCKRCNGFIGYNTNYIKAAVQLEK